MISQNERPGANLPKNRQKAQETIGKTSEDTNRGDQKQSKTGPLFITADSDVLSSLSKPDEKYIERVRQNLQDLRNTPTRELLSKAAAVTRRNNVAYTNKFGIELIKRALDAGNRENFGVYLSPYNLHRLKLGLEDLAEDENRYVRAQQLKLVNKFFNQIAKPDPANPQYPYQKIPVVLTDKLLPSGLRRAVEEELLHEVSIELLAGLSPEAIFDNYAAVVLSENLQPRYGGVSKEVLALELIAKVLLEDAEAETGGTKEQVYNVRTTFFDMLLDNGVTDEEIEAALQNVQDRLNYASNDKDFRPNSKDRREIEPEREEDISLPLRYAREVWHIPKGRRADRENRLGEGRATEQGRISGSRRQTLTEIKAGLEPRQAGPDGLKQAFSRGLFNRKIKGFPVFARSKKFEKELKATLMHLGIKSSDFIKRYLLWWGMQRQRFNFLKSQI